MCMLNKSLALALKPCAYSSRLNEQRLTLYSISRKSKKCIYTLKNRNHFHFVLIISPLVSTELSSSLSFFFSYSESYARYNSAPRQFCLKICKPIYYLFNIIKYLSSIWKFDLFSIYFNLFILYRIYFDLYCQFLF